MSSCIRRRDSSSCRAEWILHKSKSSSSPLQQNDWVSYLKKTLVHCVKVLFVGLYKERERERSRGQSAEATFSSGTPLLGPQEDIIKGNKKNSSRSSSVSSGTKVPAVTRRPTRRPFAQAVMRRSFGSGVSLWCIRLIYFQRSAQ